MKSIPLAVVSCLFLLGVAQADDNFERFVVIPSDAAPIIDGALDDWDPALFSTISVTPAVKDDDQNLIGDANIEVAMTLVNDRIYMAFRWPDSTESDLFRPWEWKVSKYKRGKQRDDMLAVRFSLSDAYDRSMLAPVNYEVDLWLWSAGRSNFIGFADDYLHTIGTRYIEDAAEYEIPTGETIYIDRQLDAGTVGYDTSKPDLTTKTEQKVGSISANAASQGSVADVQAKGIWSEGFWTVELTRLLDTGNDDDRALTTESPIITQFAIFDNINAEHKSVSEPYWLILP